MTDSTFCADDVDAMTRTLWGEARGEGRDGQIAVAWVIRNRAEYNIDPAHPEKDWWGNSPAQVCKHPWQFSCWNENDPNRQKLLALTPDSPGYRWLAGVARSVLDGAVPDPTKGATHYKVVGTKASWDKATDGKDPIIIGHHAFFRLGPRA